jgi:predicted Zn-dependent protease with MMP-like domain
MPKASKRESALRSKRPLHPPQHRYYSEDQLPPEDESDGPACLPATRMDRPAFRKLVEEAIDSIPRKFKELIENVAILVEDFPAPDTIRGLGLRSKYDLFGLYHGIPLDKRGSYYGNVPPDVILIYQVPIESACGTEEDIREQVRDTVIHEVGHFFGFSDAELRRIERENRKKRG